MRPLPKVARAPHAHLHAGKEHVMRSLSPAELLKLRSTRSAWIPFAGALAAAVLAVIAGTSAAGHGGTPPLSPRCCPICCAAARWSPPSERSPPPPADHPAKPGPGGPRNQLPRATRTRSRSTPCCEWPGGGGTFIPTAAWTLLPLSALHHRDPACQRELTKVTHIGRTEPGATPIIRICLCVEGVAVTLRSPRRAAATCASGQAGPHHRA